MNSPRPLGSSASWLALPLLLAGPASALSEPGAAADEATARRNLAFARGVATRFQYVDVAERALARVNCSGGLEEECGLVRCDVYAAGARGEPSMEKRLDLYGKAVDAYDSFISSHPYSDYVVEAERAYIALVDDYSYSAILALDSLVGEPAEALRGRVSGALEKAIERVEGLIDALSPEKTELSQSQKNDRWREMLYKGRLLLSLARTSEEGIFYFSKCEQTLEDLAFEAGEQTLWGMNAYLLMSDSKLAQNEFYDASAFASYVIDQAVPRSAVTRKDIGWVDMSQELKQRRFDLVEKGTPGTIEAFLALGKTQEATTWALHFHNTWKRDGVVLSPRGYLALLACARAFLEAGGWIGGTVADADLAWFETEDAMRSAGFRSRRDTRRAIDLALSLAQIVNEENRGNTLQVRAQKMISEIIERPGIDPDPQILFEAAQGEFNARNELAALEAFKRILRTLESRDEATQKEFGASVLYHIGASLARLDRYLEAAMAFREGATTWRGDPEFDPQNARGYYDAINIVKRRTAGDPEIEILWREAEQFRLDLEGGSQGDIVFRQAMRAYEQDDFDGARSKFLVIEASENAYEEAVVRAALCLYKQGRLDAAAQEFGRYLESYVVDPKNKLTTRTKQTARKKAMAQATYYQGVIAREKSDWQGVVKWLSGFSDKFPAQDNYGPPAFYMLIEAQLNLKDFDGAKASFAAMLEAFPDHARTGRSAFDVYRVLDQEQQLAAKEGDAGRARSLLEQMAEYIHISNKLDSSPSFNNLRAESRLWIELERWPDAETVLKRTLQAFGSSKEEATDIERYVRPDLGMVLLAQKEIPAAFEVLDKVVPDPDDDADTRKPAAEVVRNWSRSIVGWVEGDDRNVVEVPGVGGADKLEDAKTYLLKLIDREEKSGSGAGAWTCPWYELKFELAYAYYQLALLDSSKMVHAKKTIEDLQSLAQDPELHGIADSCGNDTLQRRFLWLLEKVR